LPASEVVPWIISVAAGMAGQGAASGRALSPASQQVGLLAGR
jgi:hypothetical protein